MPGFNLGGGGRRGAGFLLVFLLSVACVGAAAPLSVELSSPSGLLRATIEVGGDGRLQWSVQRGTIQVLAPSPLGLLVDGEDLGNGVSLGRVEAREIREEFPTRGVKASAVNHCVSYTVPVTCTETKTEWYLEVRIFEDGVGMRYRIPGAGARRVEGEATAWVLPKDAPIWLQNDTRNYEGIYYRSSLEALYASDDVEKRWLGAPATVEPVDGIWMLITEACLYRYSGMTLHVEEPTRLRVGFQDDPEGWEMQGEILTPWRVTLVAADLNGLVNADLIQSLGEAPDPVLFPDGMATEWIRPGKGLITWAVFGNDGAQWWRQKWFVDMCAAMNCEYLLLDGGWRSEQWGFLRDGGDLWARLTELCQYGAERNVGIFVWSAYPEGRDDGPGLTDPAERRAFLDRCKAAGVKGVKIDFFDSESRDTIEVYEAFLRETAQRRLMVNFHGANKPTGETRTWPHEITREGIREQEYLLWGDLPLEHYGALPFTRMVAGHGDFLPGYVRPQYLKNTTSVFQLATAVIFTSPFICWPDHPEAYLESPFLPLVRTMPSVWDETRVLPGSELGGLVAMARRSGHDWFVAVINCRPVPAEFDFRLDFLGDGSYRAMLIRDVGEDDKTGNLVESGRPVDAGTTWALQLSSGGGFVARMGPPTSYTE